MQTQVPTRVRRCQKMQRSDGVRAKRISSMRRWPRRTSEGRRWQRGVMAVYNMYKCIHTNKNKRDGFSSILSVERPTVYTNNPPCASPLRRHVHTNYYYFSPNHTHKTKANSPSTSSPWNTRKGFFPFFFFFLYHNEERFCACFEHPPLVNLRERLSPRYRTRIL